jgi:hypothetical protein
MAAEQAPGAVKAEEITQLSGDIGTKYKAAAEVVQKVGWLRVVSVSAMPRRQIILQLACTTFALFRGADAARIDCNSNHGRYQDC